jgi:CRP/FNR family cyclic AMP-dependent transcriptional regulator
MVGKEATIALLGPGDFLGEESVAAVAGLRLATATAMTACTALKIERKEMIRVIHQEHAFSDVFLAFVLKRSMRTQADLVDQLFNSSEKRLARILLLMAEFGSSREPLTRIPKVSQESLANMIGTTRSRVSFFMNRFRKLGFIDYNGGIHVNKSLLNVVLHDQPSEHDAQKAPLSSAEGSSKPTQSNNSDAQSLESTPLCFCVIARYYHFATCMTLAATGFGSCQPPSSVIMRSASVGPQVFGS